MGKEGRRERRGVVSVIETLGLPHFFSVSALPFCFASRLTWQKAKQLKMYWKLESKNLAVACLEKKGEAEKDGERRSP